MSEEEHWRYVAHLRLLCVRVYCATVRIRGAITVCQKGPGKAVSGTEEDNL